MLTVLWHPESNEGGLFSVFINLILPKSDGYPGKEQIDRGGFGIEKSEKLLVWKEDRTFNTIVKCQVQVSQNDSMAVFK
jgi:hypothetical protein